MLSDANLEILFTKARSHKAWLNKEITDDQIDQIYNLLKFDIFIACLVYFYIFCMDFFFSKSPPVPIKRSDMSTLSLHDFSQMISQVNACIFSNYF